MAVITMPTDEDARQAFDTYCLALGRATYAWNYILEKLANLFVTLSVSETRFAEAVWHKPDSDRVKLAMLGAVNEVVNFAEHAPTRLKAKESIKLLIANVNSIMDLRNDVVHAPCLLLVDEHGAAMEASVFTENGRAKKLSGKEVLVELDFCARWTEENTRFAVAINHALVDAEASWPDKPKKPDRKKKKDLSLQIFHPSPR